MVVFSLDENVSPPLSVLFSSVVQSGFTSTGDVDGNSSIVVATSFRLVGVMFGTCDESSIFNFASTALFFFLVVETLVLALFFDFAVEAVEKS